MKRPRGGFLWLSDEAPDFPCTRIFDPALDSFNPLKDIDYKRARSIANVLYALYPQGENTLTVRNGKRDMLQALLKSTSFSDVQGSEEVMGFMSDFLASPLLTRVLCQPTNFSFNPRSRIVARINRAELGDFDALALGLLLIESYPGQIVIPDFGFYGRDVHTALIRQERLIAGVNFLDELPDTLRNASLLIKDKQASGTTFKDAETLAQYARLTKGTNEYNDFVSEAMS